MTSGKRLVGLLRERIETGVYGPGRPLPSGRQLAAELDADRGTVMRAMEILRTQGLIKKVSPRISVVNEKRFAQPAADGLVRQAIALVAVGRSRITSHRQPGWVEYIGLGALPAIEDAGCHALSFHPARLREQGLAQLINAKPYGVVFSDLLTETGEETMLRQLAAAGVPFVIYGNSPYLANYDRVSSDQRAGCYELTRSLIDRGRRRIACCWHGWGNSPWLDERYAGYRQAMEEAGLAVRDVIEIPESGVVASADDFERASRLITGYLPEHLIGDSPADALMLNSDGNVPYVAAAIKPLGKTANRDVALAGYDHYWADAPERRFDDTPPVATIDKQNMNIGEQLVQLLCDRVEGRLDRPPQHRTVPPRLVAMAEHDSTESQRRSEP